MIALIISIVFLLIVLIQTNKINKLIDEKKSLLQNQEDLIKDCELKLKTKTNLLTEGRTLIVDALEDNEKSIKLIEKLNIKLTYSLYILKLINKNPFKLITSYRDELKDKTIALRFDKDLKELVPYKTFGKEPISNTDLYIGFDNSYFPKNGKFNLGNYKLNTIISYIEDANNNGVSSEEIELLTKTKI